MSYHIYTTEGIILKRTSFGEANLILYILTFDLGLIIASARSARLAVSKLRPALQEYTNVTLSCVKGKGGWKVTNVVALQNFYFDHPEYTHKTLAHIVSLLIKMMPGEASNPDVFKIIKEAFTHIKNLKEESVDNFEILVVLRVLFELGYVDKSSVSEKYIDAELNFDDEFLSGISTDKIKLVSVINNSLKASQL
ncbi:MAG: hypothetical protein AB201_02770 [Parcubacteria bacterium C7867-006]|nr:MAG: hypothetical protein AB201_02770 [Parcubacteria bacterium C7867-006]